MYNTSIFEHIPVTALIVCVVLALFMVLCFIVLIYAEKNLRNKNHDEELDWLIDNGLMLTCNENGWAVASDTDMSLIGEGVQTHFPTVELAIENAKKLKEKK